MSQPSGHRKSRRRQLQASHQKNWLTGRYAVLEVLKAAVWPVNRLFVADDLNAAEQTEVQRLAQSTTASLEQCSRDRLTELCGSTHHQGYIARMSAYPYATVQELLRQSAEHSEATSRPPLLVVCDRIQDTFNFGAILRCCDAMNVSGVIIGDTQQAAVTPQVARSSSGAVNHVPVATAENLTQACLEISAAGFSLAAASEKSDSAAWKCDLSKPLALIIGSEAQGVCKELIDLCRDHLRIPMLGQVSSLNAAVAAGILLYEIRRQQISASE